MFRDGSARVLVFRVGGERFAVSLLAVDEVIEASALQRMPDSPNHVRGIATLRGDLLSIYDPLALLGAPPAPERDSAKSPGATLVFTRPDGGHRVGLAVDDVYDAITIAEADMRGVPGKDGSDGALLGLVRHGSELIGVIDVDALFGAAIAVSPGENA
jgi:purine-binding chemotaxis protein CheW